MNVQLVLQPCNSFLSNPWKNIPVYSKPITYPRKVSPGLEAGVNAFYNFGGKRGKKVVYDGMYESGFYLADKIALSVGLHYCFAGQNYKKINDDLYTWSRKVRLSYLKIPFQCYFIKGKPEQNQLVYTVGVYAGFLTHYKEKNSTSTDNYSTITVAKAKNVTSTTSNLLIPGTPDITLEYSLDSRPYQSIDYGLSLGVGMQQKFTDDITAQFIFIGQFGLTDVKNTSAEYSDGTISYSYYGTNANSYKKHKNSSLGIMIALAKSFKLSASAPKTEKKRWRIFRIKGKE